MDRQLSSGVAPARKLMRVRILLKVNAGMKKAEISQALDVSINTVTNVCRIFQSVGIEAIERKKPDGEYKHSIDGEAETHLIAIACFLNHWQASVILKPQNIASLAIGHMP